MQILVINLTSIIQLLLRSVYFVDCCCIYLQICGTSIIWHHRINLASHISRYCVRWLAIRVKGFVFTIRWDSIKRQVKNKSSPWYVTFLTREHPKFVSLNENTISHQFTVYMCTLQPLFGVDTEPLLGLTSTSLIDLLVNWKSLPVGSDQSRKM